MVVATKDMLVGVKSSQCPVTRIKIADSGYVG